MSEDNYTSIPVEKEVEVKLNVLGMLISQVYGIPLSRFAELYNTYCGCKALPSSFFGENSVIKKLLYQQRDIIEIRQFEGELFVFVRDPVPAGFEKHREIVLRCRNLHSKVREVPFVGPLKKNSTVIDMETKDYGFVD